MTEPHPLIDHPTARLLRRLAASIIDTVVFALLSLAMVAVIPGYSMLDDDSSITNPWGSNPAVWAFVLAQTLLGVSYYGLAHARWGQTLGKRLLNIKVISLATGQSPTLGQAMIRALLFLGAPLIPFIGWLLALADLSWIGMDNRRQCLHDKFVQTVVISKPGQASGGGTPAPG
ncbi:RDD family protein [Nonomuraea sp. NPDC005650]|uniref:RDD family protein n=1 Tax=Nonomuraea sp. NPDC005650 TaxID=3157045 RepID=UPI0033A11B95